MFCNCKENTCECYCGSVSSSQSLHHESGVTADEYKEFLFDTLVIGSGCAPDGFFDTICNYWDIYANLSCGSNDVRYLYVRVAALTSLLGYASCRVTRRTSISETNSRSETKSKADSKTQGQSTSSNSAYSESVFESGYSDFANSILRAQSQRTAESNSRDTSRTISDDIGRGEGESLTEGERDASSDRFSEDKSSSSGTSSASGVRFGSDYSFTHQNTDSNAAYVLVSTLSREGTRGKNVKIMNSETINYTTTRRTGQSSKFLKARAWSQSWSQRESFNWFNALMDSYTWARSNAEARDHSSSTSDAEAHSAGKGQSAAETKQRSTTSNQRTSQTDSLSTSETDGYGSSYSITEYRAESQVAQNITKLLENAIETLNEVLRVRAAGRGIAIGPMLMANPNGYCNLDAISSRLRAPGGLYGIKCYPNINRGGVSYAS